MTTDYVCPACRDRLTADNYGWLISKCGFRTINPDGDLVKKRKGKKR